ncbi:unnamed protein product, partial [Brenthis ino]
MAENNIKMALSPRQTFDGQRVRIISGSAMTIATWNVKSMYRTYKVVNIEREMLRLKINILGVSESRHQGTGVLLRDDTVVYYSGNNDKNHYNDVAVIISRHLHHQVQSFLPISDRVLVLELRAKPRNIQIVQVYAPTTDATDEDNELFYEQVENALKHLNPHNIILVQGADIGSDHNPVVASLRCSMKILKPKSKRQQMDVTRLKEPEIRLKTATEINMAVDRLNKELGPNVDVEETWTKLKEKLVDTGKRILQPLKCKIKNRWITEEILSLMEQRRSHKGVDDQQYKYIHKLIQTKVLEAEEKWMVDQCIAIEEFEARYDYFNVHRKVREITGTFKTRNMNCNVLLDDQGNPAKTIEDRLNTWQNYITTLFHDVRPALESSSCGNVVVMM